MKARSLNILAGVGVGSALLLAYKPNRDRLKKVGSKLRESLPLDNPSNQEELPIDTIGHPHPDDVQDNEMVSEGAVYSVEYYNKSKQA